ncbi:hypothetical protein [Streptomyces cacaoi]|uniref:hypothetical protein n=1 Tax=Streptomyces cacaoi TaxID=1898 RepID=UPI00332C54ED
MKLDDLSAPITTLALLLARRDLPAAHIKISSIFPDRLTVSFHDNPDAFRHWLTALGLTPEDGINQAADNRAWTTVTTSYGGADIELFSFTPVEG